jgi:hypothetical protein
VTTALVVGSYPPVPLPSVEATLSAVQRAWDAGFEVMVASPRSGAADLAVPVVGFLAGHRLENLRKATGASHLVLVVEEGAPVPAWPAPCQRICAGEVARAMRRFAHVTLVSTRPPSLDLAAFAKLRAAADEVLVEPVDPVHPSGVTVTGPTEVSVRDRSRHLVGVAARKLLGPRAPAVRSRVAAWKHKVLPR